MLCRHFGVCGGCQHQNIAYDAQLKSKSQDFQNMCLNIGVPAPDFVPAPNCWRYRNKVELAFGKNAELHLGFKERGRWYSVVDLKECLIFDLELDPICRLIKQWALHEGLSPYNPRTHAGFLKFLALRKAQAQQYILMLITSAERPLPKTSLLAALRSLDPSPTAIIHAIQDHPADIATPQSIEILQGTPYLTEWLLGRSYRYHILSFFQTNVAAFSLLLNDVISFAREFLTTDRPPAQMLDFYCGVGTLTIPLAGELGLPALGIESNPQSIADARFNAAGVDVRLDFKTAKTEDVAQHLLRDPDRKDSLVILDPPRSGLHPKVLRALNAYCPAYIIYLSCNPSVAVKNDLGPLKEKYKISLAKAYDFFPHTNHYEALFVLRRA